MMRMLATFSTRGQTAYAQAGNIATEIIAAMRTVSSFNGEQKAVSNKLFYYSTHKLNS
jgi:ATP-binding cassette subfamily B (MDR/TAP) protein 1